MLTNFECHNYADFIHDSQNYPVWYTGDSRIPGKSLGYCPNESKDNGTETENVHIISAEQYHEPLEIYSTTKFGTHYDKLMSERD